LPRGRYQRRRCSGCKAGNGYRGGAGKRERRGRPGCCRGDVEKLRRSWPGTQGCRGWVDQPSRVRRSGRLSRTSPAHLREGCGCPPTSTSRRAGCGGAGGEFSGEPGARCRRQATGAGTAWTRSRASRAWRRRKWSGNSPPRWKPAAKETRPLVRFTLRRETGGLRIRSGNPLFSRSFTGRQAGGGRS